jgi:hypothetical protein
MNFAPKRDVGLGVRVKDLAHGPTQEVPGTVREFVDRTETPSSYPPTPHS